METRIAVQLIPLGATGSLDEAPLPALKPLAEWRSAYGVFPAPE